MKEHGLSRCWKCRWIGVPPTPKETAKPDLPFAGELFRGTELRRIDFDFGQRLLEYRPCNPSLAWHNYKLWLSVRIVNYEIGDAGSGPFFSYTILREIGPDLTEHHTDLGVGPTHTMIRSPLGLDTMCRGLEDVRLFAYRGELRGIACMCDQNADGRPEQITFRIDTETGYVFSSMVHQSPLPEKNWVPIVEPDRLLFVYSLRPLTLVLDERGKEVSRKPFLEGQGPSDPLLSGSSQAIPFLRGYLLVAHERVRGVYQHRFVHLNDRLQAVAMSRPFAFARIGVEFCCGMAQVDDHMVLSFGFHDREAWLCSIPIPEIEKLLYERKVFPCLV